MSTTLVHEDLVSSSPATQPVRAMTQPPPVKKSRSGPLADLIFGWVAKGAALVTLGMLLAILASLTVGAWPAINRYGLGFMASTTWDPVKEDFGGLVMIYGTLATSFIALLIAVPVSFGIALFLTELSPTWLKRPLGTAIELLAAVPSIVYGMWGLLVFGPVLATYVQQPLQNLFTGVPYLGAFVSGPPVGIGILSAGIILAIMIIPIISSVSRDVLRAVPAEQREAMYALGATPWEVISKAVVPYGRVGIIGAIILGLGRALGETMAVTMLIGNRHEIALSLFAPGYTMASLIANEFSEASNDLHLSALMAVGFVLFVMALIVNAIARYLVWQVARRSTGTTA